MEYEQKKPSNTIPCCGNTFMTHVLMSMIADMDMQVCPANKHKDNCYFRYIQAVCIRTNNKNKLIGHVNTTQ